ncbi:MAG: recombinase family protein [Amaricoccus sp.]|uniref:recombinase family protein n=1 Tax=Amaricoccus sp. TaxID=1872485 RepID=UPI003315EB6A
MTGGGDRGDHRRTEAGGAPVRAAQYVRMSTEHQQYSTENQADAIRLYADRHGLEIVRTYADEGRSGLRIEGRDALQRLIADVESGTADFGAVLVYDVSRWGRFQDADESAHYEYRCRRAGIDVRYCAEQSENDGSPISTIVKGVKRMMAAEYSRELSTKVFAGQRRLIEHGFRQGGAAGFGLRRRLIDQGGAPKTDLARGEHKSIQTDHIILVLRHPRRWRCCGGCNAPSSTRRSRKDTCRQTAAVGASWFTGGCSSLSDVIGSGLQKMDVRRNYSIKIVLTAGSDPLLKSEERTHPHIENLVVSGILGLEIVGGLHEVPSLAKYVGRQDHCFVDQVEPCDLTYDQTNRLLDREVTDLIGDHVPEIRSPHVGHGGDAD